MRIHTLAVLFVLALSACNFHVVDEGKYYRMAQPSPEQLEEAIKELGIKTVLNLRGEFPGEEWYDEEVKVVKKYPAVSLISIPMDAHEIPHRANLVRLLDAFKTAERPLLVHCQGGADRTGEASAIYQMEYMGKTKKQALKMLTPLYNHYPPFYPAKTYFISLYQGQEWAYTFYDPCLQKYKYYDQAKNCK